jgi:hypothetical protein
VLAGKGFGAEHEGEDPVGILTLQEEGPLAPIDQCIAQCGGRTSSRIGLPITLAPGDFRVETESPEEYARTAVREIGGDADWVGDVEEVGEGEAGGGGDAGRGGVRDDWVGIGGIPAGLAQDPADPADPAAPSEALVGGWAGQDLGSELWHAKAMTPEEEARRCEDPRSEPVRGSGI